jgi:hypothetical protein
MKKVFLAVLIIAIAAGSVFALSVVPNPLVRNMPWISIDWVTIDTFTDSSVTLDFLLGISIHNPTHRLYLIQVTDAELDGKLTYFYYHSLEQTLSLNWNQNLPTGTAQIFLNGAWTDLAAATELQACSPILLAIYFQSANLPTGSRVDNGTFHLTLDVSVNGDKATFSDDLSTSFVTTPTQTTTTTSTTATESFKPPNECVFPWV